MNKILYKFNKIKVVYNIIIYIIKFQKKRNNRNFLYNMFII